TFCGIPEEQLTLTESEDPERFGRMNAMYEECLDVAKRNFADFPRAKLVQGEVPGILDSVPVDSVSYLSIDMNIVKPEIAALEYFWPRLSIGAPVLLDDYGWAGHSEQREAMDEFAQSHGTSVLELPTGQGLILRTPA
ncbi:MAG: TylF/MycF/NovP-related O-methyltransferase, partial [Planctomycetaceae bacterium]